MYINASPTNLPEHMHCSILPYTDAPRQLLLPTTPVSGKFLYAPIHVAAGHRKYRGIISHDPTTIVILPFAPIIYVC